MTGWMIHFSLESAHTLAVLSVGCGGNLYSATGQKMRPGSEQGVGVANTPQQAGGLAFDGER